MNSPTSSCSDKSIPATNRPKRSSGGCSGSPIGRRWRFVARSGPISGGGVWSGSGRCCWRTVSRGTLRTVPLRPMRRMWFLVLFCLMFSVFGRFLGYSGQLFFPTHFRTRTGAFPPENRSLVQHKPDLLHPDVPAEPQPHERLLGPQDDLLQPDPDLPRLSVPKDRSTHVSMRITQDPV